MDILLNIFYFLFDYKKLKEKVDKNEKIGWVDVIISPSIRYAVMIGLVLGFLIGGFNLLTDNYFKERATIKRLSAISAEIQKIRDNTGHYPETIDEVISNNPLRKNWNMDKWDNEIKYRRGLDGNGFVLISNGRDELYETKDDIIIKN